MKRLLVLSAPLTALAKLRGAEFVVPSDSLSPEERSKLLASGTIGEAHGVDFAPYEDEHLEEDPDRKLAAQLSPRQAVLPPNLRKRRP